MKLHQTILLTSLFVNLNCGSENKSNNSDKDAAIDNRSITLYLDSDDDLPACIDSIKNQLAYVVKAATFKVCKGEKWITVDIKGKDGTNGKTGSKGKDGKDGKDGENTSEILVYGNLVSDQSDLCTRYTNVSCKITGGQFTKMANGIVQFSISLLIYQEFDIGGGKNDTDSDLAVFSVTCLPTMYWCGVVLPSIARTGSDTDRMLIAIYNTVTDTFEIYYDVDNNNELELDKDVKIQTLSTNILFEEKK